jgi:hypothetical protein
VTSKRKLLVILGAGSSIPCGMPSVPEIDYMMKKWGHEWTQTPYLPIDAGNVFNDLWDKPYPSASGGTKCCSREGGLVVEQIAN